ncbi:MAG: hypothetical protein ABFS32_19335, partial [Bacteroidota bacterium]
TVGANTVLALRSSFLPHLISCETVNPSCLPMRGGAVLGAGFAFAIFLFSNLRIAKTICYLKI